MRVDAHEAYLRERLAVLFGDAAIVLNELEQELISKGVQFSPYLENLRTSCRNHYAAFLQTARGKGGE